MSEGPRQLPQQGCQVAHLSSAHIIPTCCKMVLTLFNGLRMWQVVGQGRGRQTCKHKKMRQASSSSNSGSYFQVELLHTLAHTQSASLRVCALEWGSFIFSWRRCCSNLRRTCSSKKALKECRQQACVCGVCVGCVCFVWFC